MKTLGYIIFGIVVFGGIGSIFGSVGFIIGSVIGIIGGIGAANDEGKKNEQEVPNRIVPTKPVETVNFQQGIIPQKNTNNDISYNEIASEVIAASIVADGEVEESEIEMAILMIENDDLIIDKKGTLDKLHCYIDEYLKQRNTSKAIFKLKITTIAHRLKEINDSLKKEMLITILDNMYESVEKTERSTTKTVIDKFKFILNSRTNDPAKEDAIEKFILRSGDKEAIERYENIKKNPSNFGENLKQAAKGNSVLRTAFGVFAGVIAANLIMDSLHQYQLQAALADFDSQLEDIGGIDQLDIANGNISNVDYSQSIDPTEEMSEQGFDDIQTDSYDDFDHDIDGVELAGSDLDSSEAFDGDMDLDVDSDVGGFFDIFG